MIFCVLVAAATARASSMEMPPEMAAELQATWLIQQRSGLDSSLHGGADVVALDLSAFRVVLATATAWVPATALLLTFQSMLLAVTVVPLWRLARNVATLRVGASAALVLAFACNPLVHSLNLSGFHPEVLAMPALVLGVWAGLTGRTLMLALAVGACLAAGAVLGLAVLGLGMVLLANGRREAGLATIATGAVWFVVATFVVQPWIDASDPHLRPMAGWGDGPSGVLTGLLGDPGAVLVRMGHERTTAIIVALLAPLLFLALLVPRFAVGVLPSGMAMILASEPEELWGSAASVPLLAFAFVATTFALHRLGRSGTERVNVDRRLLAVLSFASVLFLLDGGAGSPYGQPWEWGGDEAAEQARRHIVETLDPAAAVRAEPGSLVGLAERRELHHFEPGPSPDAGRAVVGVDALVIADDHLEPWSANQRARFESGLESRGFEATYRSGGIVLWERTAEIASSPPVSLPEDPDSGWESHG